MKNVRIYGKPPFSIAVVHGGPGATGEMKPVAKQLSQYCGILEPLQTHNNINGQIQELENILNKNGIIPSTLIGHSWGAWLIYLLAAKNPDLIKKLVLIGSGPFQEKYVSKIMKTRLKRLNYEDLRSFNEKHYNLNKNNVNNKKVTYDVFTKIFLKTDTYSLINYNDQYIDFRYDVFCSIWKEAEQLRKSGQLIKIGEKIKCPIIAIHGDYDPHPVSGVKEPLSKIIKEFKLIELKKCGHYPWIEKFAKDKFYKILLSEIL